MIVLKGIIIGLIFGAPIGAVGALAIQRTLKHGIKAGLITGLASSIADCLYAGIGAFGLTFISNLMMRYEKQICVVGGLIIIMIGVSQVIGGTTKKIEPPEIDGKDDGSDVFEYDHSPVKLFLSALSIGITNPAAIVGFLFAFSIFDLNEIEGGFNSSLLVLGVFVGTYIWWLIAVMISSKYKEKKGKLNIKKLDIVFGILLIGIGAFLMLENIIIK